MIKPEYKAVSAPYVVKPHGTMFNKELELDLPVGKGKAERLEVAYLDDEETKRAARCSSAKTARSRCRKRPCAT
jgi:hypothetical protein